MDSGRTIKAVMTQLGDVGALYPNCKKDKSGLAIQEAVKICGIDFRNIDKPFLTKFVSLVTRGKSGVKVIDDFLQTLKRQTTLNSYLRRRDENRFQGPPSKALAGADR